MKKALLLLEVMIGYSLAFYLWLLGVLFMPVLILGIIERDVASVLLGMTIALGGLGFWGVLKLIIKMLAPETEIPNAQRMKIFLLSGYGAGAYLLLVQFGISSYPVNVIVLLPLLVTVHLVYESRAYLWDRS